VIGYCHLRGEVRTFRVDRIETLSETEDTFNMPAEFNVQAYMAKAFQTQNQVQVQMRFKAEAARIALNNRPAWDMCKQQADGSVVVKFSVPDLNWAASSVLAYGPAAEVLEPPELGKLLKEWASVICELYSSKGF
jgi:predicted DNA-binding transcriptional regulator YafY